MDEKEKRLLGEIRGGLIDNLPEVIKERLIGTDIGSRANTISGTGGELESRLSPIQIVSEDLCFRVYLSESPSPDVVLPSMYRGVPIGYILGRIRAFGE